MSGTKKFKLTKAAIEKRCQPSESGKPVFYWDADVQGFGVKVTRRSKSFVVQRQVNGRSKRVSIGQFGAWTVDEARKQARALVVKMDGGVDPVEERRARREKGTTFEEAIDWHLAAMRAKGCAQRSIDVIPEESQRHLSDWLKRPIASISRNECAERHERITENSGRYAANRALQQFRAVYNTANRRLEGLPQNPTIGVTFNKTTRRRAPISWADLPAWKARVDEISNPIRRDLQLLLLFTGLRSQDARSVRWEHVDFDAETVHRPKPKGGEDRAFTVPVPEVVLELFRRRRAENHLIYPDDKGWVFPSRNMKGEVVYVAQAKEQRYDAMGKKVGYLPSPHRLRDTFASAAHEALVHPMDLKILMNHRLSGSDDVTEGYIRPSIEHLRGAAESVAEFLLAKMAAEQPSVRDVG